MGIEPVNILPPNALHGEKPGKLGCDSNPSKTLFSGEEKFEK